MKVLKPVWLILWVSAASFIYVWFQVRLLDAGYALQQAERRSQMAYEDNLHLKTQYHGLVSPAHLEKALGHQLRLLTGASRPTVVALHRPSAAQTERGTSVWQRFLGLGDSAQAQAQP